MDGADLRQDVDAVAPLLPGSSRARPTFRAAVEEVVARRAAGERADLALMVGDLAVPRGERCCGAWALPPSYREELASAGLAADEVVVLGEAFCRNQGKRRLLDDARRAGTPPEATYAAQGWALVADPVGSGSCPTPPSTGTPR